MDRRRFLKGAFATAGAAGLGTLITSCRAGPADMAHTPTTPKTAEPGLLAGCAVTAITPPLDRPVYLAGFDKNRPATGVHDDLEARALALAQGDRRLVLVALDLVGVLRQECLQIQRQVEAELPGTRVIISSSHTHHGPDTLGLWGPSNLKTGRDRDYLSSLVSRAAGAATQACRSLRPARLRTASVQAPGWMKNSRDAGLLEEELIAFQVSERASGRTIATAANFACHPEVLWSKNTLITSDYPHYPRLELEAQTGAPGLFFPGALGGLLTPQVPTHTFEEAERMGRALAGITLEALSTAAEQEEPQIGWRHTEFLMPVENPLFRLAIVLGLLPRPQGRLFSMPTEASLVQLGDLWLATVPGELLPKLGIQVKGCLTSAGARIGGVIGLANDELGYILPADEFVYPRNPFEPGEHYEETMSVGKQAGPKIMAALRELLDA